MPDIRKDRNREHGPAVQHRPKFLAAGMGFAATRLLTRVTTGAPVAQTDVPAGNAGARTAWHTHPLGQTLIVTVGCGWVQCEGGPEYGEHSVSVAIDKTALIPRS